LPALKNNYVNYDLVNYISFISAVAYWNYSEDYNGRAGSYNIGYRSDPACYKSAKNYKDKIHLILLF
jgi:hypothetical protein